jgi:hypothetical protein
MTETNHTPGPWLVGGRPISGRRVFMPDDTVEINAEIGGLVACLYKTNWASGRDEANARLIAATPYMVAMLQGIVRDLAALQPSNGPSGHAYQKAVLALRQAGVAA